MRITYDADADTLRIRFLEGLYDCRTLQVNGDVALSVGPDEELVSLEVTSARRVLGEGRHPAVMLENLSRSAP